MQVSFTITFTSMGNLHRAHSLDAEESFSSSPNSLFFASSNWLISKSHISSQWEMIAYI